MPGLSEGWKDHEREPKYSVVPNFLQLECLSPSMSISANWFLQTVTALKPGTANLSEVGIATQNREFFNAPTRRSSDRRSGSSCPISTGYCEDPKAKYHLKRLRDLAENLYELGLAYMDGTETTLPNPRGRQISL